MFIFLFYVLADMLKQYRSWLGFDVLIYL